MVTLVFIPFGFARNARIRSVVQPAIGFVLLMSFLGHKEWRFVVYVVPMLNVAAAHGAQSLCVFFLPADQVDELKNDLEISLRRRKGSLLGLLAFLGVVGALALNTAATVLLTRASMANYPGGHALARLNERYRETPHGKQIILIPPTRRTKNELMPTVHVHIANLAAQSGASLFLHTHAPPYRARLGILPPFASAARPWIYNKTENLTPADIAYDSRFTHVIAENGDALPAGRWQVVDVIDGFQGWRVRKDVLGLVSEKGLEGLWRVLEMKRENMLWVFERHGE